MAWTIILLFLTVVTAVIGFLGLGFGPIEPAKIVCYILAVLLVVSFFIERRKGKRDFF